MDKDKDDQSNFGSLVEMRNRAKTSIAKDKEGKLQKQGRSMARRSVSLMEPQKLGCDVSTSNLSSFMKLDSVQYMTLKQLRGDNTHDDGDEYRYGSPSGKAEYHQSMNRRLEL